MNVIPSSRRLCTERVSRNWLTLLRLKWSWSDWSRCSSSFVTPAASNSSCWRQARRFGCDFAIIFIRFNLIQQKKNQWVEIEMFKCQWISYLSSSSRFFISMNSCWIFSSVVATWRRGTPDDPVIPDDDTLHSFEKVFQSA